MGSVKRDTSSVFSMRFFNPKELRNDIRLVKTAKVQLKGKLRLTFRKTCAYKDAHDYIESKKVKKLPKFNPLHWEVGKDSSKARLANADKLLYEKTKLLDKYRKQLVTKRALFDNKWDTLRKQELAFQSLFIKFNQFVKENEEKRERAERKIKDERQLQEKRSRDIERMAEECSRINEVKNLMEKKIKELKMYEDFLNAAVVCGFNFKNIGDVLTRYESLVETRNYLGLTQHQLFTELQHAQAAFLKKVEEKMLKQVGLENQLASLQERYKTAYAKSLQWETIVSNIHEVAVQEMAKQYMVKSCIDSMFTELHKRKKSKLIVDSNDYHAKLAFIKKTLVQICHVLYRVSRVKCETLSVGKY